MLRAAGHEVHAPTLSGLVSSSHLLQCGVDLTTHIEDITKLLFYEDLHDTVLVGHSYAGMVITGVAVSATERLSKLVYLDAYVPREGQSEFDLWPEEWQAKALADLEAGTTTRSPTSLFSLLGISNEKLAEWVKTRLTPHPLSTYMQAPPSSTPESQSLPRAYISCTVGPTVPIFAPFAERARSEGWDVHELATGHDAMLTIPYELATILIDLAR
jgi:pimeloyl-ACP methyl ester carboxylesterase